ncbi:hypothetical protein TthSNM11_12460 [Thermus thermophilus]|jgi:hypothetical protein|uniref:hypothetical protein n=1 Tax=Thermus TaxID=270 RepID=UPI000F811F44|nr:MULTISPECIES: hypothetical protein [Thermus]QWK21877.1 MAG: hypothetical protein KNN15_12875 [Thermus antranikianii]BDG19043.1 hypothetical protein TthSNM11_12460 [Thermus thermophilus]BDG22663.1 hypothetical protein TthSNM17_23250 [Thermus thermophilus]
MRSVVLVLTLLSPLVHVGWAKCVKSEDVVVEAMDVDFKSSVATALSQAVAQSRGLFVSVAEKLKEVLVTSMTDNETTATESSVFQQEITTRYGGLINGFRVQEHRRDPSGLYWAKLSVNVCLDPAVVIYVSPGFLENITESLPSWITVYMLPLDSVRGEDMLTQALSLGASIYVPIDIQASYRDIILSGNRGVSAQVIATFSALDARSGEVLDRAVFSLNSVAGSIDAANALIARELTPAVAKRLVPLLAREGGLNNNRLIALRISPLKRSGNRSLILRRLEKVPGVLKVVEESYEGDSFTFVVTLSLAPQVDSCSVAKSLSEALAPQIRTAIGECQGDQIFLKVYQE